MALEVGDYDENVGFKLFSLGFWGSRIKTVGFGRCRRFGV